MVDQSLIEKLLSDPDSTPYVVAKMLDDQEARLSEAEAEIDNFSGSSVGPADITNAINAHKADASAHPQYVGAADVTAAINAHTAAANPHSQYQLLSQKGVANGYAGLDNGGKLFAANLPNTVMQYRGQYNANTNTPNLVNGTGTTGDVYEVVVAGTRNFGAGAITFNVGDWVVYNGTIWEKSINSNEVVSVNGLTGAVNLTTTNIPQGTNLYFTAAAAKAATVADAITSGVTDVAPSQAAVFTALAGKAANVNADATTIGLVNISAQSFKGVKTFIDGLTSQGMVRSGLFRGDSQIFTVTGDISTASTQITNVVGTLPSADQQAANDYVVYARGYTGYSGQPFEVPQEVYVGIVNATTLDMFDTNGRQNGTGVTFYIVPVTRMRSDAGASAAITPPVIIGSGSNAVGSSGVTLIQSGDAVATAATVTMQGITYTTSATGWVANTYTVQTIIDATLNPQTSGTLNTSTAYLIVNYVAGDNFTNIGGTNATGTVFRPTGTTPATWTNLSTLQPIVVQGLGRRLLNRINSSTTRDQLLAAIQALYLITHDYVAVTAGGANATQTAQTAIFGNAVQVGLVSIGSSDAGAVSFDSPWIVFGNPENSSNAIFIRTPQTTGANNSAGINMASGTPIDGGNSGGVAIFSADMEGSGGSGSLNLRSGIVRGSLQSGAVNVNSGATQAISSANSGPVTINSGNIGGIAGNSGAVNITSGAINNAAATTSVSGAFNLGSGGINITTSTATTGNVTLRSGANSGLNASAGTGSLTVGSGNAATGSSGSLSLITGNSTAGVSGSLSIQTGQTQNQNSGNITIQTGAIVAAAGPVTSGQLTLKSGNSTSANGSGQVFLNSGDATGGPSGNITIATGTVAINQNSGSILINPASVSGTGVMGKVRIYNTSPNQSGYVLGNADAQGGTRWEHKTLMAQQFGTPAGADIPWPTNIRVMNFGGGSNDLGVVMPLASTLMQWETFFVINKSSFNITLKKNDGTTVIGVIPASSMGQVTLTDVATSNWNGHHFALTGFFNA